MAYMLKSGTNTYFRVVINRKGIKINKLFHSAKEANRFEREAREAIDNGTWEDEELKTRSTPTVHDMLEDYYSQILMKKNRDFVAFHATRKVQKNKIDNLVKLELNFADSTFIYHKEYKVNGKYNIQVDTIPFGKFRVTSVDRYVIERVIQALQANGLKEGSIRTYLKIVKSAFHYAKHKLYPELISSNIEIHNPFDDFIKGELPKNSNARKTVVSDDHISKALEFFSKPSRIYYLIAFKIALQTGLRKTEMLSILRSNIKAVENGATIYIPKSKNGRDRTVFVDKEVADLIASTSSKGDKLFPFSVSALNETWRRCFQKQGVRQPPWHTLKNTAISKAILSHGNSSLQLAERFQVRVDELEKLNEELNKETLIRKLQTGEKLTDKEISFLIGGHSNLSMTQHYFVANTPVG